MKILTAIDNNPKQKISFISDTQRRIDFAIWFEPTQNMWFMNVESGDFKLYGQSISVNPNLLSKYHNIIDFGVLCNTDDGLDPFGIDDFYKGYAILAVLTDNEVKSIEGEYETE